VTTALDADADTGAEEFCAEAVVLLDDDALANLKCRCRDLLAKKCPGECAPGHWLG
jgi:hypothetical protein